MRRGRVACSVGAVALSLALLPSASAQTNNTSYTVSPTQGPKGTTITVTGTTGCADNASGPDIEVFLLFGNFSGGTPAVNPGTQIEVNNGSFSGSFVAPDPDDPKYRNNAGETPGGGTGTGTFSVEARCILANGSRNGAIVDNAPTFTYVASAAPTTTTTTRVGATTTTTRAGVAGTTTTTTARPAVKATRAKGRLSLTG